MGWKQAVSSLRVALLATGDELVRGRSVDTNYSMLAGHLADAGHEVVGGRLVGDDRAAVGDAIKALAEGADAVVMTGGLGPTEDDVTREAAAALLGVPLVLHKFSRRMVMSAWKRRGLAVPESALRQAHMPRGAETLFNHVGTAPGFSFRLGKADVFCLPGPPREAEPMLLDLVIPALQRRTGGTLRSKTLYVSCSGTSESTVGERLADLMVRGRPVKVGTAALEGVVVVSVHGIGFAAGMVPGVHREVVRRLGADAYATERIQPGEDLVRRLAARRLTVAVAESCTGGLVAARLTDLPGSSKAFLGGVTAYANEVKTKILGVGEDILYRPGAVSGTVAEAMATGVRKRLGADLALGVTGVAGPAGGNPRKPVGTVWFAVADEHGARSVRRHFVGERALVRSFAANFGIDLLRRSVELSAGTAAGRQRGGDR